MTLSSVPQQSHAVSSELQACGCQLLMALSADGEYAGADRKFSSENRLQNPGGRGSHMKGAGMLVLIYLKMVS